MRLLENSTSRKIFSSLTEDFWNPCEYAQMIMNFDIDTNKWNEASKEERIAMVLPKVEEFWQEYGPEIKRKGALRRILKDLTDSNFHTEAELLRKIVAKDRRNSRKVVNESIPSMNDADFEDTVKRDFRLFLMDKYGDELYSDVSNEDVNEYFTGMFYDIWDENDLDSANAAEDIIRAEYHVSDSDDYEEYDDGDTNWAAEEAADADERFENRYMNGGNGATFNESTKYSYKADVKDKSGKGIATIKGKVNATDEKDAKGKVHEILTIDKGYKGKDIKKITVKLEESADVEEVSFDEIEHMMSVATTYDELYDAVALIKDPKIRANAEDMLDTCKRDGDEVDVAYSVTTTEYIDPYRNDENIFVESVKELKESSNVIWTSETTEDDYDKEELERNQYQDYVDNFDGTIQPMPYDEWLDSEWLGDYLYYEFNNEDNEYEEWYDFISNYPEEDLKRYYQDYLDDIKEREPDKPKDFDSWFEDYMIDDSDDQWRYKEEDLQENVLPMIDKQVNGAIFITGNYNSNYPDFRKSGPGGKIVKDGDDLINWLSDEDKVEFTNEEGNQVGIYAYDHDGSIGGLLYTLPDDQHKVLEIAMSTDYYDKNEYEDNNEIISEFMYDLSNGNVSMHDIKKPELLVPITNGFLISESTKLEEADVVGFNGMYSINCRDLARYCRDLSKLEYWYTNYSEKVKRDVDAIYDSLFSEYDSGILTKNGMLTCANRKEAEKYLNKYKVFVALDMLARSNNYELSSRKDIDAKQIKDLLIAELDKFGDNENLTEAKKNLDDLYNNEELENIWNNKFDSLVPKEGKAGDTIGEIMRCYSSLSHALLQNGDILSRLYTTGQRGYYEKACELNDAVNELGDETLINLLDKMWNTRSRSAYEHYLAEFYEYFLNKYLRDETLTEAKKPKAKKEDKRVVMQQGNVTCIKENSSYFVFENENDNEVEHDSEESAMQDFLERVGVNPNSELTESSETEESIVGTYEVYKDGNKCNIEVRQFNNDKSKMYSVDNPFKGFEWGTNFYKTKEAVKKFLSKHNAKKKV